MKKINVILLVMALLPLNTCFGKNIFTYSLQLLSPPPTIDNGKWVYPTTVSDPNKDYVYNINLTPPVGYKGQIPSMRFTFALVNGKFSDGKTTMVMSYDSIQLYKLHVKWNDISTPLADTAKISITKAYVVSDTANSSLQKGSIQKIVRKIASLKGQIPSLIAGPNRSINDNSQIIASVDDIAYPGIYVGTIIQTNKKVRQFEWTLPANWVTTTGKSGTFITDVDVKQITVVPDYVNAGSIKVRGVNDIASAYSEYDSIYFDRGFSFTAFPTSITFGDNTAKTFSTTLFSGITYEWSAPAGWKINGQGNTLEALNMNSVNVTPSFCSQVDDRVRVRLKKDGDVSPWYDSKNYQGFRKPSITAGSSTIYQYEEVNFSINNINMAGVQSINCVDNKVCFTGNQGSNFKVTFLQSGTYTIDVSMLMVGCSTPVLFPITITVLPHRIKLSGPSQLCDQATYTINLPTGASVVWSTSRQLVVTSGQGTAQAIISKQASSSAAFIRADITLCGSTSTLTKTGIKVGTQTPNIILYNSQGIYQIAPPYYTGTSYQIVAYGSGMASEPSANFSWTVNPPASCRDCFTSFYNGSSFQFIAECVGNYDFKLKYYNASECGWSDEISTNFYFNQGPVSFSIYPNPASDLLTVKLDTDSDVTLRTLSGTTSTTVEPYSIELWNEYSGLVYSVVCDESVVNIPLQNLPKGLYFVHLKTKDKPTQKKILRVE